MSRKKITSDYWKAIDVLYPSHHLNQKHMYKGESFCTDDAPNGWGNFGCKRCDAIMMLEKRGKKICPRNVRDKKTEGN